MISMQTVRMGGQQMAQESRAKDGPVPQKKTFGPAAAASDSPEKDHAVSLKDLEQSIRELQKITDSMDNKLQFSVNEELGRVVVKIVDPATNTVVKEIPSKDIQKLQQHLKDVQGLIVDEKT